MELSATASFKILCPRVFESNLNFKQLNFSVHAGDAGSNLSGGNWLMLFRIFSGQKFKKAYVCVIKRCTKV